MSDYFNLFNDNEKIWQTASLYYTPLYSQECFNLLIITWNEDRLVCKPTLDSAAIKKVFGSHNYDDIKGICANYEKELKNYYKEYKTLEGFKADYKGVVLSAFGSSIRDKPDDTLADIRELNSVLAFHNKAIRTETNEFAKKIQKQLPQYKNKFNKEIGIGYKVITVDILSSNYVVYFNKINERTGHFNGTNLTNLLPLVKRPELMKNVSPQIILHESGKDKFDNPIKAQIADLSDGKISVKTVSSDEEAIDYTQKICEVA
ncbi:MAG: hypothetical protein FWE37_03860 [Spirochaetaceae bacterium]|nr:hypothetical protein [Spirochaetaceae bacterium]